MANRVLTELEVFSEIPAPRSGHRCCATLNHLLCYGGYDSDCDNEVYSEILSFNTISKKWTELPHSRGVRTESASSSMVINGENLIVFGGSGFPFGQKNSNDLSAYSLRSNMWTKLSSDQGNAPMPKYGQSMVIAAPMGRPTLYVFSGTIGREFLDDLHCYDMEEKTWYDLWHEDSPEARYRHEVVVYQDGFYVLGGATYEQSLGFHEIWKFNFLSHRWTKLECKPFKDGEFPSPRKSHSCIIWKDTVYMCGGISQTTEPYSDIWKISLKELAWKRLDIVS